MYRVLTTKEDVFEETRKKYKCYREELGEKTTKEKLELIIEKIEPAFDEIIEQYPLPWTTLSDEQFKYMMGTYRETIKEKYFPDNEECLGEMFENKCFLDEVLGFCLTQKQRDMVVNKALKIDW